MNTVQKRAQEIIETHGEELRDALDSTVGAWMSKHGTGSSDEMASASLTAISVMTIHLSDHKAASIALYGVDDMVEIQAALEKEAADTLVETVRNIRRMRELFKAMGFKP